MGERVERDSLVAEIAGHEGIQWSKRVGAWHCRCDQPLTPQGVMAAPGDATQPWREHLADVVLAWLADALTAANAGGDETDEREGVGVSEHAIRWTFEDQHVVAEAVCHEPDGADCRLTSACDCERWGEIVRRDDGTIWHREGHDYSELDERFDWHQCFPADYCNVCLFINESGCVEELTDTRTVIDLGETPIRPVWLDDGCDWEPADRTDPTVTAAGGGAGDE